MEKNAFSGGVEPGGLWNKTDIRILLCYILNSVDGPLSGESLSNIIQGKALANYFEVQDALDSLYKQGNIVKDESGLYTVSDAGREISQSLNETLPLSVRDKALEAAMQLMAEAKARRENQVDIEPCENGFKVTCHISDGGMDFMVVSLYVPDRLQALLVERNFYKNPDRVYKLLLAPLTGDYDYARSVLSEEDEKKLQ